MTRPNVRATWFVSTALSLLTAITLLSGGCQNASVPLAGLTAEAGPDKTIALGGNTTLDGSASGGQGPYTYSWTPTSGLDNAAAAQPTASPTGTIQYTLSVTDSLGQTATDNTTVTVAAGLTAEAGPDKTIALGGNTTLEGSASGGQGPYMYNWAPTTGLNNATAAQPTASPTATIQYTLSVTDSLGQTATDNTTVTVSCQTPSNAASFAQQVLTLTNAERANVGLAALTWDNTLAQVAGNHACDMIVRNFFAHDNPDGQNVGDRATAAGYTWTAIGENLAAGHQTPAAAVAGWMNSAGHKANILNASFTALGVGYREGGSLARYWVQVFATSP